MRDHGDDNLKPTSSQNKAYSPARKAVHWIILILCIAQFPTGWAIANSHLGHVGLTQSSWSVFVHRSHALTGAALVVLVAMGVVLRLVQGPVLPPTQATPEWMGLAASATHVGLGLLLLALSGTGFIAMYVSRAAAPVHGLLIDAGLALTGLHIAGALWHQIVFRDGTLERMLPRFGRRT